MYRSLNHIYTQLIDDANGVTIASASTMSPRGRSARPAAMSKLQRLWGTLIAERAKEKGIKKVVFDRGGYLYHGRIKGPGRCSA